MKLLFLSNFYPPASRGGYEQWCQEVAEGLRDRGHEVVVLTSQFGREQTQGREPGWIRRELHLEMTFASLVNGLRFFVGREARERHNLACVARLLDELAPDAVVVWGMWNLPRSLPALLEKRLPGRVVYYLADYWPTLPSQHEMYWKTPGRSGVTRALKHGLGRLALRELARIRKAKLAFEHALCPSEFLRDELQNQGVELRAPRVISGAIDTRAFHQCESARLTRDGRVFSLLYTGRLIHDKGAHTAIKALGALQRQPGMPPLHLCIVGAGEADYEAYLRDLVTQAGVSDAVTFLGVQPKEAMPGLYGQADALLFTSIWKEPFGRVLVEAMAASIPVISTATGGAAEIMRAAQNTLLFAPDDAAGLAAQITRLVETPHLRQELVGIGRRVAAEKFDISRMVLDIETYLIEMAA